MLIIGPQCYPLKQIHTDSDTGITGDILQYWNTGGNWNTDAKQENSNRTSAFLTPTTENRCCTLSYVTLSSITWNYYFSGNENNTNKHLLKSGVDITVWKTTDCLLELQHLLLIACHILDVATSHVHTIWSILLLSVFATQSADFVQLNSIKQKTSNKILQL